eukprot:8685762-Pyramimonas_sp.AAC.1
MLYSWPFVFTPALDNAGKCVDRRQSVLAPSIRHSCGAARVLDSVGGTIDVAQVMLPQPAWGCRCVSGKLRGT